VHARRANGLIVDPLAVDIVKQGGGVQHAHVGEAKPPAELPSEEEEEVELVDWDDDDDDDDVAPPSGASLAPSPGESSAAEVLAAPGCGDAVASARLRSIVVQPAVSL